MITEFGDGPVQINLKQLLDDLDGFKNKIIEMEMAERETKAKVLELAKVLGKNRPRASTLWESLKEWAQEK